MRLFPGFSLVVLGLLWGGPDLRADDERLAVPSRADQAKAEDLVRDLFKTDYRKTRRADQLVLSARLLEQGLETKDDPAGRYVLLREAAILAARAGALEQGLSAVNELTGSFATSGAAIKADVCEAAAPTHTG